MSYSLYNEDCMKILPTIDDKSIECIITDLPYGVVTDNGKDREQYKGQLRSINKGNADIQTFKIKDFLREISRVSNGCIYLFCAYEDLSEIFKYFHDNKDFMVRMCYWHKTNPSPMNGQHMYLNAVEPIVFAKRRKTTFNAKCCHNVFEFPTGRSKIHPTEKPIPLLQQLILDSTCEYDTVADFCGGSFSTGIASLELDRNFIGVELDNIYFELAKQRIIDKFGIE